MLKTLSSARKAQSAVEFMLLLAVVVSIVLIGFRTFLQRTHDASGVFFNNISTGVMGKPSACGDGVCDPYFEINQDRCCTDCGGC